MVRSVTTFDPDWDDDDISWALSWAKDSTERCSGCSHLKSETFDRDRATAYDAEPLVCHACAARDRAARAWRENKGDESGVYWAITERKEVDLDG